MNPADHKSNSLDLVLLEAICRRAGFRFHDSLARPLSQWIQERVKILSLANAADYFAWLGDLGHLNAERAGLSNVSSSRETYFLRDHGQMDVFRQVVLPKLVEARAAEKRLRVWSVGCSTGEEPYTLAILIRESGLFGADWQLEIIGFDIDAMAIHQAKRGRYHDWSFRGCPESFRNRYFHAERDAWLIDESLRKLVQFQELDLLAANALTANRADVIFCRNVFIYLNSAAIELATSRLLNSLADGGYLFCAPGELARYSQPELAAYAFPAAVVYRKLLPATKETTTRSYPAPAAEPIFSSPAISSQSMPSETAIVDTTALMKRAWLAANRGKLDESNSLCTQVRLANPLDPEAYYLSAILASAVGAIDEARAELRRVLYLAPDFVLAYPVLAELCLASADTVAAERYGRQGLARVHALSAEMRMSVFCSATVAEVGAHLDLLMAGLADRI